MFHPAGLAMHQVLRPNNFSAECLTDSLVSKTHAQNRHLAGEVPDEFDADSRVLWRTRSGRNNDALRSHLLNVRDRHLVVAPNFHVSPEFTYVLNQVKGERIVIIENENHKPVASR